MNILILFGGVSSEHDISIKSANSIVKNIDREKYTVHIVYITKDGKWRYIEDMNNLNSNIKAILSPESQDGLIIFKETIETIKIDTIFPVLHGKNGEDGTIQGLFEISNTNYVGCGVSASANAMDKSITKIIVDNINVPQSPYKLIIKHNYDENMISDIEYPVFVKPCASGSSVGVAKAYCQEELDKSIKEAFKYDDKVLIEKNIIGKEIEVAVLGTTDPIASVVGEIEPLKDFYTFDAKYVDHTSKLFIPARISDESSDEVRKYAVEIYKALGCTGLSRVDFFITNDEEIIFNEINTLPGFTDISMYPKLFEKSGVEYKDLISKLIEFGGEKIG